MESEETEDEEVKPKAEKMKAEGVTKSESGEYVENMEEHKRHIRTHTKAKPFSFQHCSKALSLVL